MAEALKHNFNRTTVELLAARFSSVESSFDAAAFTDDVMETLLDLELKDRVNLVADQLAKHLPDHYPTALASVVSVAETDPGDWESWPLCSFVERHGLEWPTESLDAMAPLTRRWSCEFAIRPYLEHHLHLTRTYLDRWVDDPDEAVRRLPSEGTRPLLPWGPKVRSLIDDPEIGLTALRALRHDPSETVRRSVANHLNDLAKANPRLVIDTLRDWTERPDPVDPGMVRHALRTLVKNGDPGALQLLGFTTDPEVELEAFECDPTNVELGTSIELLATLRSTAAVDQRLVVDFVVHHVLANGSTSQKVFKWTTIDLAPGATVELRKKRRIQTASTRRYHAGHHRIDLQVAGQTVGSTGFQLDRGSPQANDEGSERS